MGWGACIWRFDSNHSDRCLTFKTDRQTSYSSAITGEEVGRSHLPVLFYGVGGTQKTYCEHPYLSSVTMKRVLALHKKRMGKRPFKPYDTKIEDTCSFLGHHPHSHLQSHCLCPAPAENFHHGVHGKPLIRWRDPEEAGSSHQSPFSIGKPLQLIKIVTAVTVSRNSQGQGYGQ